MFCKWNIENINFTYFDTLSTDNFLNGIVLLTKIFYLHWKYPLYFCATQVLLLQGKLKLNFP